MKKNLLALVALSGLALSAQEHGVSVLYTLSKPSDFNDQATIGHIETDTYKGLGLRYSQTVGKAFGGARVDFEGTWKLRTSGSDLKVDGVNPNTASTTYTLHQESMGLGLAATWTQVVDFGVALDIRQDNTLFKMKANTGQQVLFGSAVVRPWLGLRVGYTVPTGSVKPTFGLEYGLPLSKQEGGFTSEADIPSHLRPKNELSLTAGIRF